MTRICLVICLLLSGRLFAQPYDDNRFRLSTALTFNGPMGQQHFRNSDRFITGKSRSGYGFYLSAAKPVYKGFMIGASISRSTFTLLEGELKTQLIARYGQSGFFASATGTNLSISITQLGLDLAKNIDFKGGCFTPYVRFSLATVDADPVLGVRLKQKNDNYFIQYNIVPKYSEEEEFDTFLPTVGFNLEGRINDYFWIHGGLSYTGGSYRVRFSESRTDLYEERRSGTFDVKQPVSMINAALGIQCRFGRR